MTNIKLLELIRNLTASNKKILIDNLISSNTLLSFSSFSGLGEKYLQTEIKNIRGDISIYNYRIGLYMVVISKLNGNDFSILFAGVNDYTLYSKAIQDFISTK